MLAPMAGKVSGERLGELLIRKGLLTREQMEQAVQCQVIFGGRLGTNLLELGHVGEAELNEALAQKCGVPAVRREELEDIPPPVIQLLSRESAERCQAVPVRLAGTNLYTAMLDPDDSALLNTLSTTTGKTIQPGVALEVYLRWALDRYYGIRREARFINLERTLTRRREIEADPARRADLQSAAKPLGPGDTFWAGSQTIPFFPMEPLLPDPQSITAMEGAPKSLEDFWERVGRTSHPHHLLPRVFRQLQAADSRDRIAQIILDFGERLLPRIALFFIKEGMVFGWDARGERLSRGQVSGIMIPLDRPSVFRTVVETGAFFLGPVPDTPFNRRLLSALGNFNPPAVLLLPMLLAERVVAILYGDMGPGAKPLPDFADLQAVLVEAQRAFQKLILASKTHA